jgi:MFS family permease
MFYGWAVVSAAAVGLFLGFVPIIGFTFSVFFNAIASEFHWNRSEISLGFSFSLLALSIALPISGKLVDRIGARRVIVPGAVLFGLGLMAFTLLTNRLWQFYLTYLFIGIVGSGTAPTPYYKVISCWFERQRGLALGIAMGGAGLGSSLMPYLAHSLIQSSGWRTAYLVVGVMVIAITVPVVSAFLVENPTQKGLHADAVTGRTSTDNYAEGVTAIEARHSSSFWLMCGSFFLMSVTLNGCLIHMVPMLTDLGISSNRAAIAASILGAATLVGRVGTGYLLDRLAPNWVAMVLFLLSAAGMALLWSGIAGSPAFVAAFLVGMGLGAEGDIMAYMVSRYFGVRSFGEIYGLCLTIYTVGAIIGPMVMAVGFDSTHSYHVILGPFFFAALVAALLIRQLGAYQKWQVAAAK